VQQETVKFWVRLTFSSVVQVILYHLGIFFSLFLMLLIRNSVLQIPIYFVFYLLPLQITFIRKGREAFLYSIFISFVILLLFRLYMASAVLKNIREMTITRSDLVIFKDVGAVIFPLILVELATLASLVGGLTLVNLYYDKRRGTLYKMLSATAGAAMVGIVLALLLNANRIFVSTMEKLFAEIMQYFRAMLMEMSSASQGGEEAAPPLQGLNPSVLMRGFWYYVIGGFAFGYFINLSITLYAGRVWEARTYGRLSRLKRLTHFYLPDNFIWPLIGFWSVVLASRFVNLHGVEIIAWNGGLVFLFLYGLQGLGILRHLMTRYRILRRLNLLIIMSILIVIFFPPLTIVLIILVPGLGVSEIWIKYRLERKEKDEE
jgi:hypothetical protein